MVHRPHMLALPAAIIVAASMVLASCGSASSSPVSKPVVLTSVTTGANSHVHVLQVQANGDLLLADQQGLWTGTANGRHWRATGGPVNRLMSTCIVRTAGVELVCSTTYSTKFLGVPTGVWRTTSKGRHWTRSPLADKDVIYLATNPSLPGVVVAFARANGTSGPGSGGIWVSRNAGASWRRVNRAVANSNLPIGLTVNPVHTRREPRRGSTSSSRPPFAITFAETAGLHISTDMGRTWHLDSVHGSTILAIAQSTHTPTEVFVAGLELPAGSGRLWEGEPDRGNWTSIARVAPTSLLAPAQDSSVDVYGFSSSPKTTVYRADAKGCATAHCPAVIHRGTAPAVSDQVAMAVNPTHPNIVYAAFSFPLRLYRSDNSGRTWRKLL